jgi:hypothetical protein
MDLKVKFITAEAQRAQRKSAQRNQQANWAKNVVKAAFVHDRQQVPGFSANGCAFLCVSSAPLW